MVNDSPANAEELRDVGSVPGLGRRPEKGHGSPLQYSLLENPVERRAWRATVLGSQRVGHARAANTHTPWGSAPVSVLTKYREPSNVKE